MLLSEKEENYVWDRVYTELNFKPSCEIRKHIFTCNLPFNMDKQHVVYGIENMKDEHVDKMKYLVKNAFIECTCVGDKIYALDWQHSCFLYDPRVDSEQKSIWVDDSKYTGGGYNAYFPSFYPDGDYYFFIHENFNFGYLGHPWRREIWIWGDNLIEHFNKIYKDLGWNKLK